MNGADLTRYLGLALVMLPGVLALFGVPDPSRFFVFMLPGTSLSLWKSEHGSLWGPLGLLVAGALSLAGVLWSLWQHQERTLFWSFFPLFVLMLLAIPFAAYRWRQVARQVKAGSGG